MELDDRAALLQLELDGTVEKLAELRGKLAATQDAAARKDLLSRISEHARRALLLDAAARRVAAEDAKAPPPLGEALKKVGPQIEDLKGKATDEGETLKELGDDPFKLTPQGLDGDRPLGAGHGRHDDRARGGAAGDHRARQRPHDRGAARPRVAADLGGRLGQGQGRPERQDDPRSEARLLLPPRLHEPRGQPRRPHGAVRPQVVRGPVRRARPCRHRGRRRARDDDAHVGERRRRRPPPGPRGLHLRGHEAPELRARHGHGPEDAVRRPLRQPRGRRRLRRRGGLAGRLRAVHRARSRRSASPRRSACSSGATTRC